MNRKINYETFKNLEYNFSDRTKTAVTSFRDYCFQVRRMETKIALIKAEEQQYSDSFTKQDNNRIIRELDVKRTDLHNNAIANVKDLNYLSGRLGLDEFMDGAITESSKNRGEIAEALFEFCETIKQQEDDKAYSILNSPNKTAENTGIQNEKTATDLQSKSEQPTLADLHRRFSNSNNADYSTQNTPENNGLDGP